MRLQARALFHGDRSVTGGIIVDTFVRQACQWAAIPQTRAREAEQSANDMEFLGGGPEGCFLPKKGPPETALKKSVTFLLATALSAQ
jgi:hypothetical protein